MADVEHLEKDRKAGKPLLAWSGGLNKCWVIAHWRETDGWHGDGWGRLAGNERPSYWTQLPPPREEGPPLVKEPS